MMTDDEIGEQIRGRGLEEEYIRELMASLGFDPAEGFTNDGIEALDNASMEQRRKAALRTLALGEDHPPAEGSDEGDAGPLES
ncbi:hypothetical protein [Longimicrobium sp.]|uniref:hypothetical protein n=1 Tax=Longimicrobium sp. TaxID=2029185 RepID=UPI002E311E38|nr:hypothetical protein [Longimicrobium sp.]HEX6040146.1 hypothetical protein [Longimicrobium sp.]